MLRSAAGCLWRRALAPGARLLDVQRAALSGSAPLGACGLNADQEEFRRLAETFAAGELMPHGAAWDAGEVFPVETFRKAAGLGFAGMGVDGRYGGAGLGCADAAVILEALAYGDVPAAAYLSIHNMVAGAIARFGSDRQKEELLPALTSMDRLCSYCLTEPGSGSDAASLATTARKQDGAYVLNGTKAFISGAGVADLYLVMARTGGSGPGGISSFLVDKGVEGLSFGKQEDKLGWRSQPTKMVIFDGVRVAEGARLGPEGEGFKIAMSSLDRGRINIAAVGVGGAQFCLDAAMRYSKERKQFGKEIGQFQSSQFKLSDMVTRLHGSRLMVRSAARAADEQSATATLEAAMAKRFATDACFQVANDAMQLLGGYGYLRDYPVERYFRDLRVLSILEGTNEIMRVVISKEMEKLFGEK
ncbi:unnamed protein product [Ostreobium quekettii]|uniref:Isobutyryl-CoA dehydrogenase, mitochondrial n=1 Tax=Ostreobium quekettii TaxID=121088 RepID=A0A8S1JIX7_9CHLO|nr:unnamed protein product [Ostreobium quekettii]|eukprot:evm.model.scf_816.4 EVM.evm.TU.scf_816.4   scf_816:32290-37648(+)